MSPKTDGYQNRSISSPLGGEEELDRLAALWDLVKPFAVSAKVTIAGTTTTPQLVVATSLGKGREGVLTGFACDFTGGDFSTSPWLIQHASKSQQGAVSLDGKIMQGPFTTPVGALATPLILPWPIPIRRDAEVAIVGTNGLGASFDFSGFLMGITWSYEQNRDIRRALWGEFGKMGKWDGMLFGGGAKR